MPLKKTNILPIYNPLSIPFAGDEGNTSFTSQSLFSNFSTSTTPPTISPNATTKPALIMVPPCQWLLHEELDSSRVRLWDVVILIPNVFFLLFLLLRMRTAIVKLRNTNSPIFLAFYGLVFVVAVISVLRCVVSMTVNAAVSVGDITDKLLWLILRFFLLATELSVVTFGLAFGHLDSKTSIRRVLLVTSFIALGYSITQGTLEFMYPDQRFHVQKPDHEYDIFGHGGMMFWFASSVFFFVIYAFIVMLPCTNLQDRFSLPTKKSFYWYSGFLALLNLLQAVGSGMLYYAISEGLCVVNITAYIYFTTFAPLVYITFLREFFATTQPPSILFSYKAQVDEPTEEDNLSLPHQSVNSGKTAEQEAVPSASYDSTHFDASSPNPLYNVDLHFQPDFYDTRRSINADIHSTDMEA